jgi:hypothetical protein
MVIGFLAWGEVPTLGLFAGSAIVVASGLFLLWHEAQGKQKAESLSSGERAGTPQRPRELLTRAGVAWRR